MLPTDNIDALDVEIVGPQGEPQVPLDFIPQLPGDVNADGYVGGLDLTTIITNWGINPATRLQGDLSGDGTVSGPDYTEVITYWGTGTPPPPEGIPEPAALALLLIGGLLGLSWRGIRPLN